jgi:hypothetical protein
MKPACSIACDPKTRKFARSFAPKIIRSTDPLSRRRREVKVVMTDPMRSIQGFAGYASSREREAFCGDNFSLWFHPIVWESISSRSAISACERQMMERPAARYCSAPLGPSPSKCFSKKESRALRRRVQVTVQKYWRRPVARAVSLEIWPISEISPILGAASAKARSAAPCSAPSGDGDKTTIGVSRHFKVISSQWRNALTLLYLVARGTRAPVAMAGRPDHRDRRARSLSSAKVYAHWPIGATRQSAEILKQVGQREYATARPVPRAIVYRCCLFCAAAVTVDL